ncbi:MAG: tetratricopeptide repeat protein, partial [Vulcanimicrobiota bacterium]
TYQAMGKNKEALASYTESINQDPGMNEVFLSRAEVYAELGQYRRAREDAEMYSSKNINNPEALYNLGIYSRMSGEPKEAEKYLNEAIALEPDDPLYRFERGFLFLITKQFDKAEEDFNKLLELAPENPLGLLGRASVYEETHKYQKALELYNQVIKKYPDNFLAYTSRGDYYSLVKDYEETIADFDKAIELTSGEDESVYIDRAEKFELFGEYKQSEEDLKKALELDENNYFALMNLAVLNIKQGNREKARQNLEKANANSVENEIIADLYPALYYFYDRDYKEVIERTTRLKQNYLKTDMAPVEAISYYFLKDPETALKTIKFALSQDSGEPYLNIFNYIFAKKNGIDKKQELTKFLKNSEIAAWPIPVVKLYAGQISPKQFLKQLNQLKDPVSKRLIQTEAYYYLGQFYLFNNDKNMAKKYFQQTEKSSVINEEFVLAEYELNKLK